MRTAPVPTLRPYQVEAGRAIVDSVLNGRGLTFTVVMARQAGKNELSAQVEMFLLLKNARRPLDAIKAAPTFAPQCQVSMRRLWGNLALSGLAQIAQREDGRAVRIGQARALFLSAEAGSNVVGHTAGLLLEVDEAQDVDREKFDREFRPMAATTGATTVYYGTPWDESTLLEQAVQHNLELQRRDGVRRHFAADWTEVARYNAGYARFVEAERERLGANHPLFLTQFALKPIPGAGRLFTASQRGQLQGSHARQYGAVYGETYVAGLDIGGQEFLRDAPSLRYGAPQDERNREHDATVLTIARVLEPRADALVREPRLEVVEQIALTGVSHDVLLAQLVDLLGRVWRVSRVVVDATGLGETLARLLERALGADAVRPLKLTSESKSRIGYELIAAVNSGRLSVYAADGSPEYAESWRQVEAARVAYRPSRQMNFYVDPADGHDDYLVSLALTVEAASDGLPAPRVARGRVPVLN